MEPMPAKFPQELKERAIQLVLDAVDNGCRRQWRIRHCCFQKDRHRTRYKPELLRIWVHKHHEITAASPKEATDLAEENRRLRAELAESRRANEILRTASTFFGAELDRQQR